MKAILKLSFKSIMNRKLTTGLTTLSLALSVMLILGLNKIKENAQSSFTGAVNSIDLIVGAKGGKLDLLLSTLFHVGNPSNPISIETYNRYRSHPQISKLIPLSLGDSHKGHRVVATNNDFFTNYKLAAGKIFADHHDVVIGSDVANLLHYKLGDKIIISHGVHESEGVSDHDHHPFVISGILAHTHTPLDQALYINLESMSEVHEGAEINTITAMLVQTKSRIYTLFLQREIELDTKDSLMAIIPALTLNELWTALEVFEKTLTFITYLVLIISLLSLTITLYNTLHERRYEMAVYRSLGATPLHIFSLYVFESSFLTIFGLLLGILFTTLAIDGLQSTLLNYGIIVHGLYLNPEDFKTLSFILLSGTILGIIPALKAYFQTVHDGLNS